MSGFYALRDGSPMRLPAAPGTAQGGAWAHGPRSLAPLLPWVHWPGLLLALPLNACRGLQVRRRGLHRQRRGRAWHRSHMAPGAPRRTRLNATAAGAECLPASSSACSSAQLSRMRWSRDILRPDMAWAGRARLAGVPRTGGARRERAQRGAERAPVNDRAVADSALIERPPAPGIYQTARCLLLAGGRGLGELRLALARARHPAPRPGRGPRSC
jgi:hypothetical protein